MLRETFQRPPEMGTLDSHTRKNVFMLRSQPDRRTGEVGATIYRLTTLDTVTLRTVEPGRGSGYLTLPGGRNVEHS